VNDSPGERALSRVIKRLPADVAEKVSPELLSALATALEPEYQTRHAIDWRGTVPVLFTHKRVYFVFLAGQNRRSISREEREVSAWLLLTLLLAMGLCIFLTILLGLYLFKSEMGIDFFPGFSLGIWDWFRRL